MMKGMVRFIGARNKSALKLVGAMGLALYLGSAVAYADNLGGHAGHGWPNSAVGCFQGSFAKMINHCSSEKLLVIPLQIRRDNITTKMIVFASGNGSAATTCYGIRSNVGNVSAATGARSTISASGDWLDLGGLFLPPGQGITLAVECKVAPGGSVQLASMSQ